MNDIQSRAEEILYDTIHGEEYNGAPESRVEELLLELKKAIEEGGGGGGTTNYNLLSNLPKINDVTLSGNKSASDLGLATDDVFIGASALVDGKKGLVPKPGLGDKEKVLYGDGTWKTPSSGDARYNYSTGEQVVGTWIDGRPVYQRVVSMTMPDATTKYAITNIPDMDDIFLIFAYEKSSNSVISMDPAYGSDKKLHGYVWFTNANHADGARVILEAHDNDWAGVPVTICFQYTKTTD